MSRRTAILRVFADSSAFFALIDRRDQRHAEARAIQGRLIRQRARLYTTNLVVAETHALLLARLSQAIATAFLHEMAQSRTTVLWVTPDDFEQARNLIDRYDDKDFSLTNATSFVVMERAGIAAAFTFDHHFAQYGLTVLGAEER